VSWEQGGPHKEYSGIDYTFMSQGYQFSDCGTISSDLGVTLFPMTLWASQAIKLILPSIPCGPVFDAVNECLLAKTASAGVLLAPSSDPTAPTPRDPRASATRLVGCQRLDWLLQASSASWRGLQSQLSGCANCSPQPKVSECKTSRRQWMSRPCSQRTCR